MVATSARNNPTLAEAFRPVALIGRNKAGRSGGARPPAESLLGSLEMLVAPLIELVVGVTHGLGPPAAEHDLDVDGREAGVLVAVDDAGRTSDAFPWAESRGQPLAGFILDEDVEKALQHEEALLDLVRMRRVALAGLDIDDREREIARRDDGRIVVLAGTAGADEAVLGAL